MDAATSRTIRIGRASIGLIGLDVALNQAAAKKLPIEKAVEFLFTAVSRKNYIPVAAEDRYREALRKTYLFHLSPEDHAPDHLVIRIFGSGCVSCSNMQRQVIEVLDNMSRAADIEQVTDPDEIGRHGITLTPALMINGRVMSGGLLPTRAQIEHWLREVS